MAIQTNTTISDLLCSEIMKLGVIPTYDNMDDSSKKAKSFHVDSQLNYGKS